MEFNIAEQERLDLLELAPLIRANRATYSSVEQDKLYSLFNRIFSQKKTPNGCGACLRATLTSLKKCLQIVERV
jgi:hypothetical protein